MSALHGIPAVDCHPRRTMFSNDEIRSHNSTWRPEFRVLARPTYPDPVLTIVINCMKKPNKKNIFKIPAIETTLNLRRICSKTCVTNFAWSYAIFIRWRPLFLNASGTVKVHWLIWPFLFFWPVVMYIFVKPACGLTYMQWVNWAIRTN